jgi:hypothetical protein
LGGLDIKQVIGLEIEREVFNESDDYFNAYFKPNTN